MKVYDIRKQVQQLGSADAVGGQLEQAQIEAEWISIDGTGGAWGSVGPLLVIRQTRQVHAAIQNLLK